MSNQQEIDVSVARIKEMETLFDQLTQAYDALLPSDLKAPAIREIVHTLHHYYISGEWMHDYVLDEAGLIPKTLKRGVLSEDGLYHLLCDVMDILDE